MDILRRELDNPTFESKNDISLPEIPDYLIEDITQDSLEKIDDRWD